MIYFDNAATTKPDPLVLAKMNVYLVQKYGNPSSYHKCGKEACEALEEARYIISSSLKCAPTEIIFTSGATESNNLAIKSCASICTKTDHDHFEEIEDSIKKEEKKYNYIFSEIEHKSVLNIKDWLECAGYEVRFMETLSSGEVDVEHLKTIIDENTMFISCMYVNNETGIIQPVEKISNIVKIVNGYRQKNNIDFPLLFHIDATQAYGKFEINLTRLNVHFLSASAHKLHGVKGSGILYKNRGLNLECMIEGGSQEHGLRAGTENVPGIVAFGKAVDLAIKNLEKDLKYGEYLETYFVKKMKSLGIDFELHGDITIKSPWIFNLSFGIDADELMEKLPNFCFSKSSACSKVFKPSHVLESMGLEDEMIKTSVRISFSKYTTTEEIDLFLSEIKNLQN